MSYESTIDERRLALSSLYKTGVDFGAKEVGSATFGLIAIGDPADGKITDDEVDDYDLGYLDAGDYSVAVTLFNWDELALNPSSALSFSLVSEAGDVVQSTNSETLTFTLNGVTRLFLSVQGPASASEVQYRVQVESGKALLPRTTTVSDYIFSNTEAGLSYNAGASLTAVVNTADREILTSHQVTVHIDGRDIVAPVIDGRLHLDANIAGDKKFTLSAQLSNSSAVTISDVISQLRDIVGLSKLEGRAHSAADVDHSGTVTISDVISSLRVIVGLSKIGESHLVAADGSKQFTRDTLPDELFLVTPGDVDSSWSDPDATGLRSDLPEVNSAPVISSIVISSATGSQNNYLSADDVVTVKVTMSEATTVNGTPQVALTIGSETKYANYSSGSGTKELLFTYTIEAVLTDADGISIDANALSLNSGTLTDSAGNNAVLTHSAVADNGSFMVDTIAPEAPVITTSSGKSTDSTPTITGTAEAYSTVYLYDGVTLLGQSTVDGSEAWSVTSSALADATYSLTAKISDASGNTSPASTAVSLTIDAAAPVISSIAITSATGVMNNYLNTDDVLTVTATMDEVSLVDTSSGTPRVALTIGGNTRYADYVSGSGSTSLVFAYTIEAGLSDADGISIGSNAVQLNSGSITSASGENATLTHAAVAADSSYKVDTAAPTYSSVALANDSLSVQVIYSEALSSTGLSADMFNLQVGGVSHAIDSISVTGSVLSLNLASAIPAGPAITVTYAATASNSIKDLAGNAATDFEATVVRGSAPTASAYVTTSIADSGNTAIDVLLNGEKWGGALGTGATLTYSFPSWTSGAPTFYGVDGSSTYSSYNEPYASTVFGLNAAQQANVRTALEYWGQVANLTFVEVSESSAEVGDLRFAFSSDVTGSTWGWGWLPSQYYPSGGDVWINPDVATESWAPGSYNFMAMLHEIGHALGFKHPFEGDPSISYDNHALTVMSYTEATGATWWTDNGSSFDGVYVSPESPMIYDIAAAQYVYGVNSAYNAGDTTYTFDESDPFFRTIWDASGNDTISLTNFTLNCVIDLTPGSYSSVHYYEYISSNIINEIENNLGIAYNCWIENAIGGSGDDLIIGNSLANQLTGGAGVDTFRFLIGESTTANCDVITDFSGDKISIYNASGKVAICSAGSDVAVTSSTAGYNSSSLIVDLSTLALSSLSEAVAAVEVAIDAAGNALIGQSGLFNYLSNGYLFVSDGVDGVGNNDIVVKLDGKHVGTGATITSGELEIGVVAAPAISITGISSSKLTENSTYTSATPTAVDAVGTVTWSITGADAALFSVDNSTGVVTMTARNYESPTDDGSDNVYNYNLVATDADSNQVSRAVVVTVTDVQESSTLTISNVSSTVSVNENSGYISSLPSVSGAIGTVTYTLTGDDKDLFTVNSSTGVVQLTARDYENPVDTGGDNIYNYDLVATDSDANSASQSVAVSITNVAELVLSVDNTTVNVAENAAHPDNSPEVSGALTAVTWSISGTDADLFNIDTSTGDVTFKTAPNFEDPQDAGANNVYNYTLTVTDEESHTASQAISVHVTDVVETATLTLSNISDATIDENTSYSAVQPSVSGAIGSVTWSLSGDDASQFSVNASTGVVTLSARDYEAPTDTGSDNSYNYTLTATDADGNSADQAVTVSISDVSETNTLTMSAFTIADVQIIDADLAVTNTAELNSGFEFIFSENIDSLAGTIYLKTSDGLVLESFTSSSAGVSVAGNKLTLTPSWSLLPSTDYYFEMGAGAIRSIAGNTNAAIASADTDFTSGVETRHSTIAEQFYQTIPGSQGAEQFGDHYTITVAIDYQDKYEEAYDHLTQVSDMSSASIYFADTSYGNMSMNVSLAQDFMMPYSLWAADTGGMGSSTGIIKELVYAELTERGILAPDVNLIILNSHGWLKDGTGAGASFGGGDWSTNAWSGMDVIVHEGGHALGMAHSNMYSPYRSDSVESYGNTWDVQGGGSGFEGQYILPYLRANYDHYKEEGREGLGWIEEAVLLKNPDIGTYRLYAYDDAYFSSDRIHGVTIETTFSDGKIEYENKVGGVDSKSEKVVLTFEHRTTDELLDSGILITRDTYLIGADLDQNGDGNHTRSDKASAVAPLLLGQTFEYDSNKFVTVVNNGEGYVDLVFAEGGSSNTDPEARVTISTDQVNSLDYVDFSVAAYDADGDSFAYFWQFSDGYKTSESNFSRYFDLDKLGTETSVGVTLVVSDMHGGTKTFSDTINVGTSYTSDNPVVLGSLASSTTSSVPTLKLTSSVVVVNEGSGNFILTVSDINGASTADTLVVPVTYTFFDVDGNDVTAANSGRLTSLPSTVSIMAGTDSAQLSLRLNDNSTIQETTLLKVTLGSGTGYQLAPQDRSITVQLQDDDRPVVSLRVVDDIATEASRDSAIVEFSRTGDLTDALTVYYSFAGSATFGADYAPLSGSVVFEVGESKAYLPIRAIDDPWGETRETLFIFTTSLDGSYNVDPLAKHGLIQILDNADLPVVNVWSDGFGVEDMGSDPNYEFTTYYAKDLAPSFKISVVGSMEVPIDVVFELSGNATISDDYTLSGATITALGNNKYNLVADASKTTLYQIFVNPVDDSVDEDSELVTLTIVDDASYQIGSKPQADMVLHDNDKGPLVSVSINQVGSVSEGDGTVDLFKIYSDSSFSGDVAYSVSGGSADEGTDFQSIGTIRFSNDRSKTIPITFLDDSIPEGVETIKFELLSGTGYSLSNINTASVHITDNDTHDKKVGFAADSYLVSESDAAADRVQELVVNLNAASTEDIYVDYVASGGTALGMGTDWAFWDPLTNSISRPSQLHFAAGETKKSIFIKVFQDSIAERIEEIDIALKNARGADVDIAQQVTRLVIADGELSSSALLLEERWLGIETYETNNWTTTPPHVSTFTDSFTKQSDSLVEKFSRKISGTITARETGTYTFRLLNDGGDKARVYLSSDSTADNKQVLFPDVYRSDSWDYTTITLHAGQNYYMELQQRGDDFNDFVIVEWKSPSGDFIPVTKSGVVEPEGLTSNHYVRFAETELSVAEGNDLFATLTLDRPATSAVTVDLAVESGSADFAKWTYTVVFAAGELSKSVLVQPVSDGNSESAESFTLAITNVDGALAIENGRVAIRVTDDPTSWLSERAIALDNPADNDVLFDLGVLSTEVVNWSIVNGNPQLERAPGDLINGFGINPNGELVVLNSAAFANISEPISLGIKGTLISGDEICVPLVLLSEPEPGVKESVYFDIQSNDYAFYWQDWDMAPLAERNVSNFTLSASDSVAGNYYTTHRFVSLLQAETSGKYKFTIVGKDEPVRLFLGSSSDENSKQEIANYRHWDNYYISDDVIADAGGNQVDEEQYSAEIELQAGELYWIEVISATTKYSGEVEILWELPDGVIETIPSKNLINPSILDNYAHDWNSTHPALSWNADFYSDIVDANLNAGDTTNDSTLGLSGTTDAGAEVTLYVNGVANTSVTANSSGVWSLISDILPEGENTLALSIASVGGGYLTSEARTIKVKTREVLDDARIATLDKTELGLVSNSTLTASELTLSSEAGYVAALVDDITAFGSSSANYTDSATSGADIVLFSTRDQSQKLITADKTDSMASFGADVTDIVTSPSGRYVVYQTSDISNLDSGQSGDFVDGGTNIVIYDIYTGVSRLATHGSVALTSTATDGIIKGVTDTYLIVETEQARSYGSFTNDSSSNYTDLIRVDLATGDQHLISHAASDLLASSKADVKFEGLAANGSILVFSAGDASKLISGEADNNNETDFFSVDLDSGTVTRLTPDVASGATLVDIDESGTFAVFKVNDATDFSFTDSATSSADYISVDLTDGSSQLLTGTAADPGVSAAAPISIWNKVENGYFYFWVNDSTDFSASFIEVDKGLDTLLRSNLETGVVEMVSHNALSTTTALYGYFDEEFGVISSSTGRYVAFAARMDTDADNGGFTTNNSGRGIFVVDTQTGDVKLANYGLVNGSKQIMDSGSSEDDANKRLLHISDEGDLVFQTSYIASLADFSVASGMSSANDHGLVYYDFSSETVRLLTHGTNAKELTAESEFIAMSNDGLSAYFSAPDATKFGDASGAFTDSATTIDDIFKVTLATGAIELVSGTGGVSYGKAATFVGESSTGEAIIAMVDVSAVSDAGGTITDNNTTGVDLLVTRDKLLDLTWLSDDVHATGGTRSDDITSEVLLEIQAFVDPGMDVYIKLDGTAQQAVTADADGLARWYLFGLDEGDHTVALFSGDLDIPIGMDSSATLEFTVDRTNAPANLRYGAETIGSDTALAATSDVYLEVSGFDGSHHDQIDATAHSLTLDGDLTVDLRKLIESDVASGNSIQLIKAETLNGDFDAVALVGLEQVNARLSIQQDIGVSTLDALVLEIV